MLIESLAQKTKLAMMTVVSATIRRLRRHLRLHGLVLHLFGHQGAATDICIGRRHSFFGGTGQIGSELHDGGESTHPTLSSILLQPATRQRLYQVDGRQGDVYGRRHSLETETGDGRERVLFDIISSSAVCTIMCDSIQFDEHERKFTYYGTQLIKRVYPAT